MSKYHFLRVFRRLTGVTPHQYLISARLRRAALALASSREPVIAVALDAGFGDLSTFNKTFRAAFGLTPTQYRASRLLRLKAKSIGPVSILSGHGCGAKIKNVLSVRAQLVVSCRRGTDVFVAMGSGIDPLLGTIFLKYLCRIRT